MLANRSVPRSTVIPELVYQDVEKTAKWLCDTFGGPRLKSPLWIVFSA